MQQVIASQSMRCWQGSERRQAGWGWPAWKQGSQWRGAHSGGPASEFPAVCGELGLLASGTERRRGWVIIVKHDAAAAGWAESRHEPAPSSLLAGPSVHLEPRETHPQRSGTGPPAGRRVTDRWSSNCPRRGLSGHVASFARGTQGGEGSPPPLARVAAPAQSTPRPKAPGEAEGGVLGFLRVGGRSPCPAALSLQCTVRTSPPASRRAR